MNADVERALGRLYTEGGDRRWRGMGVVAAVSTLGWVVGNAAFQTGLRRDVGAALSLVAILVALAAMQRLPRLRAPVWAGSALVALVGIAAGLEGLWQAEWTAMGWRGAIGPGWSPAISLATTALGVGWLASEPRRRPLSLLRERGSAGWLARRSLPLLVLFPAVAAWLQSEHAVQQAAETWEGAFAFVALSFVVFLTLFWRAADALDGVDGHRYQLEAKNQEISDLYDRAPCGYHTLDDRGRLIRINETELAWLGYRREEALGQEYAAWMTPAGRARFQRYVADLPGTGAAMEFEVELRRKDGSWMPAVIAAAAVYSRGGEGVQVRASVSDATVRRQAEAALRRSEARNRAILTSAADAIVTLGEDGGIVDFNPAAARMFGMPRTVAVERWGKELLAEGSALRHLRLDALAQGAEQESPRLHEFRARRADGTEFPAELTVTRVAGQTPCLYTAMVRDLTERQRAEAALRASEAQLRLLLESTGEGIYALDREGRCTLCNPAGVRMLGYGSDQELLGRPMHALVHHTRADGGPYAASECRSYVAARAGEGVVVDDELFWRQDGSSFPVEYHSYPIERDGEWVGLVVTFSDITDRRAMEGQVRQAQKMEAVGRLAAGVAHDFNNLLTVINGYAEMLIETVEDMGIRDKLTRVRAAGDRAAALTQQLLAFSRQQVLQPQLLQVNEAVLALVPLLRGSLGERIELRLNLESELDLVRADPGQLDQVLMNLVINARDALPEGGYVDIITDRTRLPEPACSSQLAAGSYVRLAVRDNGTGMQPEVQAHIFEPFFTTKPMGKGTGLGLPTVFGIARQSGGGVQVESAWGEGTTVSVFLPATEAEEAHAATAGERGRSC